MTSSSTAMGSAHPNGGAMDVRPLGSAHEEQDETGDAGRGGDDGEEDHRKVSSGLDAIGLAGSRSGAAADSAWREGSYCER